MGLNNSGSEVSFQCFWIGIILVSYHSAGISPVLKDLLNIPSKACMWFLGMFISKRLWILSVPGYDFVSRSGSEQFNSFTLVEIWLKSADFSG